MADFTQPEERYLLREALQSWVGEEPDLLLSLLDAVDKVARERDAALTACRRFDSIIHQAISARIYAHVIRELGPLAHSEVAKFAVACPECSATIAPHVGIGWKPDEQKVEVEFRFGDAEREDLVKTLGNLLADRGGEVEALKRRIRAINELRVLSTLGARFTGDNIRQVEKLLDEWSKDTGDPALVLITPRGSDG